MSRIGAIATVGDPHTDLDAWTVGADWLYRTSRLFGGQQLDHRLWILKSDREGEDRGQLAWGTRLAYPNDAFSWSLQYHELQEGFDPALGRTPRPGTRSYSGHVALRERTEGAVRFYETELNAAVFTDLRNVEDTREVVALAAVEGRVGDRAEVRWVHRYDRGGFGIWPGVFVPAGDYTFDAAVLLLTTSPTRPVAASLFASAGEFYDGTRYDLDPSVTVRVGPHWAVSASMSNAFVRLPQGDFDARLARLRLSWQPTPDVVWSTFVQWSNRSDAIGVQSRLQWIVTPGREVFVVLTQDVPDVDTDARRGRTLAIAKIGWTLRF